MIITRITSLCIAIGCESHRMVLTLSRSMYAVWRNLFYKLIHPAKNYLLYFSRSVYFLKILAISQLETFLHSGILRLKEIDFSINLVRLLHLLNCFIFVGELFSSVKYCFVFESRYPKGIAKTVCCLGNYQRIKG